MRLRYLRSDCILLSSYYTLLYSLLACNLARSQVRSRRRSDDVLSHFAKDILKGLVEREERGQPLLVVQASANGSCPRDRADVKLKGKFVVRMYERMNMHMCE